MYKERFKWSGMHVAFQSWLLESQGVPRTLAMYVLDPRFILFFIVKMTLDYLEA